VDVSRGRKGCRVLTPSGLDGPPVGGLFKSRGRRRLNPNSVAGAVATPARATWRTAAKQCRSAAVGPAAARYGQDKLAPVLAGSPGPQYTELEQKTNLSPPPFGSTHTTVSGWRAVEVSAIAGWMGRQGPNSPSRRALVTRRKPRRQGLFVNLRGFTPTRPAAGRYGRSVERFWRAGSPRRQKPRDLTRPRSRLPRPPHRHLTLVVGTKAAEPTRSVRCFRDPWLSGTCPPAVVVSPTCPRGPSGGERVTPDAPGLSHPGSG